MVERVTGSGLKIHLNEQVKPVEITSTSKQDPILKTIKKQEQNEVKCFGKLCLIEKINTNSVS